MIFLSKLILLLTLGCLDYLLFYDIGEIALHLQRPYGDEAFILGFFSVFGYAIARLIYGYGGTWRILKLSGISGDTR